MNTELIAAAEGIRRGEFEADAHPEWRRYYSRIADHLLDDDVESFTHWGIIAQTMFVGDYDDTQRQYEALRSRPDWSTRWEPALMENTVGGATKSQIHPPSSGNQIRQAYVLARFEDEMGARLDSFEQIVEFGAGFGAMCLLVHHLGFRGRYVIVDNQPIRALQRWYLARNGLTLSPDGEMGQGICTLPTSDLTRALKVKHTAFLANWSLSETEPRFRDQVFRALHIAEPAAIWVTYQKTFAIDNGRYFASKIQEFTEVYEATLRPFRPDAPTADYYYGHFCLALRRLPGRHFPEFENGLEPAPFEVDHMEQLTLGDLHHRIRTAIVSKSPFSVIRLGDGEARIIGYPKYLPRTLVSDIWQTWFGRSDFTDDQVERVRENLKQACLGVDVMGVPRAAADVLSEFGRVKALLPREGFVLRTTPLCHAGFHLGLYREQRYRSLFEGVPRVAVIGPRDLRDILPGAIGVPEVRWLPVPPEMKFSDLPEEDRTAQVQSYAHLRTRYSDLMEVEIPRALASWPGLVVLVGAGVLGKIYCHRVKQLGGIAIDVGSMMDVWAGLKTRDNQNFEGLRAVLN